MAHFYFFRNDGACSYMRKELNEYIPKYLMGPISHEGNTRSYYCVLNWIHRENKGATLEHINELGINYVKTLDELPPGGGIYISGYDLDLDDFDTIKKNNIPYIERSCPWIKQLRNQLLNANTETHQIIFMIIKGHMVHDCYKSRFPDDIIIIEPDNFKEIIKAEKNNKPIQLLVYAAFRKKDVLDVIDYINKYYPHKDNITDGYKKTLCIWTKQGLFKEIDQAINTFSLNEIWIVCSSEHDTSARSIIRQINDNRTPYRIIKREKDIPVSITDRQAIGILYSAIPLTERIKNLIDIIIERFKVNNNNTLDWEKEIERVKR